MKKKIFLHVLITFSTLYLGVSSGYAQISDELIFNVDQFQRNILIYAPAVIDTSTQFTGSLITRAYTGVYAGVNAHVANANWNNISDEKRNYSLGMYAHQYNMGEFIRLNRLYLNYMIRLNLSKELSMTAGMNFGIKSIVLDGSNVGGGGASTLLSSGIGLGVSRKHWTLAFGYKDFLNDRYNFNQTVLEIEPSYHCYLLSKYPFLNNRSSLGLHLLNSYSESFGYNLNANFLLYFKNSVEAGSGYRSDKGVYWMLGFSKIKWQSITCDLSFSQLIIPLANANILSNNAYELSLKINYD